MNMKINRKNITKHLDRLEFESLFIEELGWDYPEDNTDKSINIDEQIFTLTPIAEKRGFNVFLCLLENQSIPLSPTLKKIDQEVSKYSYEHFIIYVSEIDKTQKWQWIKKEVNKPLANRTVEYSTQKKEALLQVLDTIAVDLEEEENLNLLEVKSKAKKAFDVDKVTKKFYDKFKKEHSQFLSFIEGINIDFDQEWYASLILNRLMFVYFIQKKGFLDGNINYLRDKLKALTPPTPLSQRARGESDSSQFSPLPVGEGLGVRVKFYSFYRYFLLRLFHDGLGSQNRTPELDNLLGKVPYLNGGLFEVHPLEIKYPNINIKDSAFEQIFTFFDQYNWHLDERPLKQDNEINPDVLGYIFEKYINQKQMGAYYTKEDITEYISKNCIIPYLFDTVKQDLLGYLSPEEVNHNLGFYLLQENPDRYIYSAVKKGVDLPLPDDITKGINDVSQRNNWNIPADENYGLPTELWREFIARRNRCLEIREKLTKGEITNINDLITYNLNIRQFAQDAISNLNSPLILNIFYQKLASMSILDPTCGSGAFLFSALNILEPLYDACLEKMQEFTLTPPTPLSQRAKGELSHSPGERVEKWEISPELAQKMKEIARKLRKETTPSEKILWEALKNRQLCQQKFRRQHPIGVFVVDFYCHEKKLIIEIDGSIHNLPEQKILDRQRQELLESLGLRFLRISSKQVETDLRETLKIIEKNLFLSPESNSPLASWERGAGGVRAKFQGILANIRSHSHNSNENSARKYFILKNIILNNLFGVDIMEEATEICKLRLFLKLASQVTSNPNNKNYGIEPLPDIDFNIRCGNSLVGFANYQEVEKAVKGDSQTKLDLFDDMSIINDKAKAVSEVYQTFRSMQTQSDNGINFRETKQKLQASLAGLNDELNQYLAREYGIDIKKKKEFEKWLISHQPFHWFTEFYSIINHGGFDVIIGNPPYVEYKDIKTNYQPINYITKTCSNLFVYILEKCTFLSHQNSYIGMIIPLSAFSTDRMTPLINHIKQTSLELYLANFSWRPGKLFDGVNLQLTILLQKMGYKNNNIYTTKYILWESETRPQLFSKIEFTATNDNRLSGSIPKLGNKKGALILDKLRKEKSEIGHYFTKKSNNIVFYRRGGLYWKVFVDFPTESSEEKIIYLLENIDKYLIVAVLSSNLWFWYFTITSDCRHLGNRDINTFPLDIKNLSNEIYKKLAFLGEKYVNDLKLNAENTIRVYKGKKSVECLSFKVNQSKPIIDEIDKILAEHYEFTEEELDFIINYDIKYRMGKELGEED